MDYHCNQTKPIYAMSRTCYDFHEVMTDKGSIEVQFCIEYEAYGWYKNEPGDIEIIDVTPTSFKYISDGGGNFKKVPLSVEETEDVDAWLAVASMELFEDAATKHFESLEKEPF